MIFGVDVYSGYGEIDWRAAFTNGVRFAYIKCTEGNEAARNDRRFRQNVDNAKDAGVLVGAYHFAYALPRDGVHTGRTPIEQVTRAFEASRGLGRGPGELPPVVDAEWPEVGEWGKWGCSGPQISMWLKEYCQHAAELWGRPPVIYTYPFWWRALASSADVAWAAAYPLWIASYKWSGSGLPPANAKPEIPAPWKTAAVWQYSAEGSRERVPGIPACPIDRDAFIGTGDDLRKFANLPPDEETQPEINLANFDIVHPLPGDDDEPPPEAA